MASRPYIIAHVSSVCKSLSYLHTLFLKRYSLLKILSSLFIFRYRSTHSVFFIFYFRSMVLIQISVPDEERPNTLRKEWAIIELQGTLEMQAHCKDDPLAGKFIGDLHFTKSGEPMLIIGHHILYGKMSKLEKPFAIIRKRTGSPSKVKTGSQKDENNEECATRYDVMGLIKHKLLFNQRPKPIIANVPKKV